MAKRSDVADKIITALAEYLKRDRATISPDHHLRDDLGLDSMAVIELLYKIEEAFDLQIPDEDLPGLTTVAHVIGYVEGRLEPPTGDPAGAKPTARPAPTRKKR